MVNIVISEKSLEYDNECCECMLELYSNQRDILFEFFWTTKLIFLSL